MTNQSPAEDLRQQINSKVSSSIAVWRAHYKISGVNAPNLKHITDVLTREITEAVTAYAATVEREAAIGVGDTVVNTSGWGVGSTDQTPLKVKSVLLEVEWEGSKSTRWLNSKEVSRHAALQGPREETDEPTM